MCVWICICIRICVYVYICTPLSLSLHHPQNVVHTCPRALSRASSNQQLHNPNPTTYNSSKGAASATATAAEQQQPVNVILNATSLHWLLGQVAYDTGVRQLAVPGAFVRLSVGLGWFWTCIVCRHMLFALGGAPPTV